MSITRREMCSLLPALLAAVQTPSVCAAENEDLATGAFAFNKAPLHVANNNAQVRLMFRGKLATGEAVQVHETSLPAGGSPTTTTHHHPHSEMWLIRQGVIQFTANGKNYRLDPGSVGFVRSNEEHGITNVGKGPAIYFVVAVGPDADLYE
jgi:mannose-6-phosphate isomerase-like protein (cupin superfamily)